MGLIKTRFISTMYQQILPCACIEHMYIPSGLFDMSKKISKKASSIRTISLAVGSLSLLVIALAQLKDNKVCTSNAYLIENQIKLS